MVSVLFRHQPIPLTRCIEKMKPMVLTDAILELTNTATVPRPPTLVAKATIVSVGPCTRSLLGRTKSL